ncbi:hypothetical protein [Curtobacterium sp. MCBD17_028]|uniref:hypothetical protein n=1 Tax=Curtobacterium sp. MCBD17_028 TaxID=2175670 RepID=UPI000DA6EB12|nr:hypothetical protein [Curtobacterium sp. MCBD17_028]PZE27912.1 hypothetical protein DEI86_04765 [Curtobacterium sp. MCBD17_028]
MAVRVDLRLTDVVTTTDTQTPGAATSPAGTPALAVPTARGHRARDRRTHASRARHSGTPRPTAGARVKGVVVTLAGVFGIACVAWWLVAKIVGLSLVVVTTGSMTPTIPAGGIAVDHQEPAATLRPGMIVTVPKPDADLPVTHRIVRVDTVPGHPEARSLTLRGDANAIEDPNPYVVDHAGVVLAHAPRVGSLLVTVTSAPVRGLAVALVGLLVIWAFWPAGERTAPGARTRNDAAASTEATTGKP